MPAVQKFNHIAILVEDIQAALGFWQGALGIQVAQVQDVPAENAQIAFLPVAGSEIELVMPTNADSGLARFLEKRGPGMHHVCLEVDDLEGMLASLKEKGVQLINEEPRTTEDGRRYAFIHPKSANGVMVELYEVRSGG